MEEYVKKIKLLGYHYKEYTEININNGVYLCKEGNKLITVEDVQCMRDIYYIEKNPKIKIPANTLVDINYCWANVYGTYINVNYNGQKYDIESSKLKYKKYARNK